MNDEGDANKEYVVNAYLLKSDYGKMRIPDIKVWLCGCSDEINKLKPQVTVKSFDQYVRADIKTPSKDARKMITK